MSARESRPFSAARVRTPRVPVTKRLRRPGGSDAIAFVHQQDVGLEFLRQGQSLGLAGAQVGCSRNRLGGAYFKPCRRILGPRTDRRGSL
jgi:hypothetical protein